jgi:glycosyltransferase involved in cell wall biosynthesis
MRILQISSAKHYGGGERHFIDLCRGLQARGHEVFAAVRPTNDWESRLGFLRPENFLHVSIRNSFGIFSARRMAGFIRDKEIDIIHAHVARDYVPASLACALAKRGRFVLTRHVLFPLKPFNKFALKNLAKAIAVSSAVEAGLRKVFPAEKIAVIPNGIDVGHNPGEDLPRLREEFRQLHNIPPDAVIVGTIGELIPLKGQRDLILAAPEIVKENTAAYFVVVGKDNSLDQKYRRELKRLVKVFGLAERFLWLDWVEDTAPLFAAIDLFVSPSHSESFGLAILEAMARGKAVVATETEGAKELLRDKDLLVPINDPVKLGSKISELLTQPERREQVGERLRKLAEENFSLERMVAETERLYLDICQYRLR